MKASIGGFSFYQLLSEGEMDIFGYLETVKFRYRLDAVDLWNGFFCDRNVPIWTLADEDYLRKIRKALDEKQLTVANLAVDRAHLWDPDPEVREQLHQMRCCICVQRIFWERSRFVLIRAGARAP